MSGFCAVVNLDGAPVERGLLDAMTRTMAVRGPDRQDIWIGGQAGFGHALLATTAEAERERQPCSLDADTWITADARIDGRDELRASLRAGGRRHLDEATDVELILHAYHLWGEACVERLLGDFSFAIWECRRQRLFCARDHFGIKPFFYAAVGNSLVLGNTLETVRLHPGVSPALDEQYMADFLLFGASQSPAISAFADVARLCAAHRMSWSAAEGLQIARYWALSEGPIAQYGSDAEVVERFDALLGKAVSDRLRTTRIAVAMSGGLDSSSVAAVAAKQLRRSSAAATLSAHAVVYDHLVPDTERHFSGLAAQALGIPMHYLAADGYRLYQDWRGAGGRTPEPVHAPLGAMVRDARRSIAASARVCLTGWDGDALLSQSIRPHLRALWRSGRYRQAVRDLWRFAAIERTLEAPGWRLWMRRLRAPPGSGIDPEDDFPAWLDPDFERRLALREQWRSRRWLAQSPDARRAYAMRIYQTMALRSFFEHYDAGQTGEALEYRHPLMDLRLLEFGLTLPPQPWLVKKHILREAMRGLLPEAVRTRRKTPMAGSAVVELLRRGAWTQFEPSATPRSLRKFINSDTLLQADQVVRQPRTAWADLTPLSLFAWLAAQESRH